MNFFKRRMIAASSDGIIVLAVVLIVELLFKLLNFPIKKAEGSLFSPHVYFLFCFMYEYFMITYRRVTIGKQMMYLVVNGQGGRTMTNKTIFIRCFLKSFSLSYLYYIIAAISLLMIATNDAQSSLHDLIAKTAVYTVKKRG